MTLARSRLVDYLASATKVDSTRRGPIEATSTAASPLMVRLADVSTPVPASIVGTRPVASDVGKKCLVIEAGGGTRYFMGVLNG